MVRGVRSMEADKPAGEDLEPYFRLVEMQKQMIDLIQQNAHTRRECAALHEQLVRELAAVARPQRRGLSERLRQSASGVIQRLLRREGWSAGWNQPFVGRGSSTSAQSSSLQS
jgi:hypothetical protein